MIAWELLKCWSKQPCFVNKLLFVNTTLQGLKIPQFVRWWWGVAEFNERSTKANLFTLLPNNQIITLNWEMVVVVVARKVKINYFITLAKRWKEWGGGGLLKWILLIKIQLCLSLRARHLGFSHDQTEARRYNPIVRI